MGNIDFSWVLAQYVILLFSLCVHEFAHAWSAQLCGDDTARLQGRMTLNPFSHIDPIGTVVVPLLMLASPAGRFLFGWARPVPVNPRHFGQYRRDDMIVSLAGIAANLVIAVLAVVALRVVGVLLGQGVNVPRDVIAFVHQFMLLNIILAVFNLIPVPPLDGFQFAKHFLPMRMRWNVHKLYRYGPILLILLIMTPIPGLLISPVYYVFLSLAGAG